MCLNKAKLDSEQNSVSANFTFATEVCYSCTRHFLFSTFYSYKTARTCIEPSSVERRLSFAAEVTTASGNWKHPPPLKIIFSARFQWLLCFRNGWYLIPPTVRNTRTAPLKCISRIYIYIYIYIYVYMYRVFNWTTTMSVSLASLIRQL